LPEREDPFFGVFSGNYIVKVIDLVEKAKNRRQLMGGGIRFHHQLNVTK